VWDNDDEDTAESVKDTRVSSCILKMHLVHVEEELIFLAMRQFVVCRPESHSYDFAKGITRRNLVVV
jgi:hypothetical protein